MPSKPLQVTSRLNGRAYAAAGQAVASLHTMAVLQVYQADLLKDLDNGQGLLPDEVAELRRTRIGDGHRRLVLRLVPLSHLRVGVKGGTGRREVGET